MRLAIKFIELLLNFLYAILKIVIPTKDKIVLISRQSDTPSLDFQLLEEELKYRGMETVVLCKTLNKTVTGLLGYSLHMLQQMFHLAGAKGLVLDGYCIVASLLQHKRDLKIIQIWHSMGSMKKFGYTIMGKEEGSGVKLARAMKMHQNYDCVLISSKAYQEDISSGFHCSKEIIHIFPLPRLDLLTGVRPYEKEIREKIYRKYPQLQEKETILYCPTFRKGDESRLEEALCSLIGQIDFESYHLVVKLHPLSKIQIKEERVITADEFSTFDMIFVSDYVISDYSCVVYEAAVRNIPLYFYAFDFEKYETSRGLAIDYREECPGLISSNGKEILEAIASKSYDWKALEDFAHKFVHPTTHATSDMADFILKVLT